MTITTPKGFQASGVTAGLKASGKPDMALVVNEGPLQVAAGRFTGNRVKAAPVKWSQQVLKTGALKAVIGDGLSYEERGVFHPQEHRYVLDAIPSRMADKVTTKITMFTTVTGENRCRLNVEATVTAKIFMVGTLLEQKTLADLRRSYEKNAAFSNRFIRENGLT